MLGWCQEPTKHEIHQKINGTIAATKIPVRGSERRHTNHKPIRDIVIIKPIS
jgi:hypothetical protein